MRLRHFTTGLFVWLAVVATAGPAAAHGLAGKRFFPATLAVDDPFVADELSLPLISHIRRPGDADEGSVLETILVGELAKRITPSFGISLGSSLLHQNPDTGKSRTGFGNLEIGLKYQFFKSDVHEAIMAVGLGWEVGGTGSRKVGAESFDVVNPALFFGKGLGDLPESAAFVRPLAVTGLFGIDIPTRASTRTITLTEDGDVNVERERHPNVLRWGFTVQYSLQYLQSFVRDVGLPAPFNRLIPLVEVAFETPLDRGQAGRTTGTVNPGFIWAGRAFQVGIEAVIPTNDRTGRNVGVRGVLHFFLDDLFPNSIGRPLFGSAR